jgi:uncharacterized protein (TIGR00369 family)
LNIDPGALTGLERLRAGLASSGDRVPFADLLHTRVVDSEPGSVTVLADFPDWIGDLVATSLPGPLATIADGAGGFSVLTRLPAGRMSVTSQLRVDFVGPIQPTSGPWSSRATCAYVTDDVGLSHGDIRNGTGDVVGRSTLWAAVVDSPAPTRAPPRGVVVAHDEQGLSPPEAIPAAARRLLDLPVAARLGIACLAAGEGRSRLRVPPQVDLANSVASMHGGAVALLGDFTCAVALATLEVTAASGAMAPLWMQVDYLRPVLMTGGSEFAAGVSWRSRRMALVDGDVIGPGGAACARFKQAWLV